MIEIEIVSATRWSETEFWDKSPLGRSLQRLAWDARIFAEIACSNRQPLPVVYNRRIRADDGPEILVFLHDDIWIDDFFLADRIIEGCSQFDVLGVAGNRRRVPQQPAWVFVDTDFTWDDPSNLSGAVAHGDQPFGCVTPFGPAPAACELLDGLFLVARRSTLKTHDVFFDERFDFHFYDMDFCRTARLRGLQLGTWPICLTHQSAGNYRDVRWATNYQRYLQKWVD